MSGSVSTICAQRKYIFFCPNSTLSPVLTNFFISSVFSGRMAGVNGDRKGKKDDNGIGTAIDFMLSNAKLVLGVGGAAMLGIATLAVKRVSQKRIISQLFIPLHSSSPLT